TPRASASERPSLTAASCVGAIACGALGTMGISCSRTALGCETSTSPDCTLDNDPWFSSLDTHSVWPPPRSALSHSVHLGAIEARKGFPGACALSDTHGSAQAVSSACEARW